MAEGRRPSALSIADPAFVAIGHYGGVGLSIVGLKATEPAFDTGLQAVTAEGAGFLLRSLSFVGPDFAGGYFGRPSRITKPRQGRSFVTLATELQAGAVGQRLEGRHWNG